MIIIGASCQVRNQLRAPTFSVLRVPLAPETCLISHRVFDFAPYRDVRN